jgi:hypothetical protein
MDWMVSFINRKGRKGENKMLYIYSLFVMQKLMVLARRFLREERGDEILEKAAVIGAMTVAVIVIIALAVAAAAALNKGTTWFGG